MRQLTFIRPGTLEWWDVAEPTLENDEQALVRPLAVARCDLDYYIYLGGYRNPGPFAFGHEIVGEVVAVGDKVFGFKPGDRVIVPFQINCGKCKNCLRGWTNACEAVPACASYGLGTAVDLDFGGGFSDLIRVPFAQAMLVALPSELSPEAGCGLSDNIADGFRTVAPLLERFPGEPVLIVGGLAQSVGLYAVQAALALSSTHVRYTDFDQSRLDLATAMGAVTERVDYSEMAQNADRFLITVDTSATAEGLRYALRSTAPCGFCTGVSGGLTTATEIPLPGLYLRGITYDVSRVHARAVLPKVIQHACSGTLDPLAFAKAAVPFAEAIAAMDDPAPKIIFTR